MIGNFGEAGRLLLRGIMVHRSDLYVSPVGLQAPHRKLARALLPVMSKFRAGGRIKATASLAWPDDEAAIAK